MRNKLIAVVMITGAVLAMAQTFGPPQMTLGSPIATAVSQCAVQPVHTASICPVEATPGVISYYFWNGSGYVLPSTGAVTSVFGRTGDVVATNADYNYSQIANTPPPPPVTSVNGKTGAVVLNATTSLQ